MQAGAEARLASEDEIVFSQLTCRHTAHIYVTATAQDESPVSELQ